MKLPYHEQFGPGKQINYNVIAVFRISNPDPDPRGQKCPTKMKTVEKFHVLKCWMFSLEGLKASPVAVFWTSYMET
jgi:hypothetical protein